MEWIEVKIATKDNNMGRLSLIHLRELIQMISEDSDMDNCERHVCICQECELYRSCKRELIRRENRKDK